MNKLDMKFLRLFEEINETEETEKPKKISRTKKPNEICSICGASFPYDRSQRDYANRYCSNCNTPEKVMAFKNSGSITYKIKGEMEKFFFKGQTSEQRLEGIKKFAIIVNKYGGKAKYARQISKDEKTTQHPFNGALRLAGVGLKEFNEILKEVERKHGRKKEWASSGFQKFQEFLGKGDDLKTVKELVELAKKENFSRKYRLNLVQIKGTLTTRGYSVKDADNIIAQFKNPEKRGTNESIFFDIISKLSKNDKNIKIKNNKVLGIDRRGNRDYNMDVDIYIEDGNRRYGILWDGMHHMKPLGLNSKKTTLGKIKHIESFLSKNLFALKKIDKFTKDGIHIFVIEDTTRNFSNYPNEVAKMLVDKYNNGTLLEAKVGAEYLKTIKKRLTKWNTNLKILKQSPEWKIYEKTSETNKNKEKRDALQKELTSVLFKDQTEPHLLTYKKSTI